MVPVLEHLRDTHARREDIYIFFFFNYSLIMEKAINVHIVCILPFLRANSILFVVNVLPSSSFPNDHNHEHNLWYMQFISLNRGTQVVRPLCSCLFLSMIMITFPHSRLECGVFIWGNNTRLHSAINLLDCSEINVAEICRAIVFQEKKYDALYSFYRGTRAERII